MNDKKNIERLFQEKFKDFEVLPPNNTWNTIASKLEDSNKNKKRRIFSNWFKASGIAASLILSYFLIDSNFLINNSNSFKETNNEIVVDAETKSYIPSEKGTNSNQNESTIIKNSIVLKNNNIVDKNKEDSIFKSDSNLSKTSQSKTSFADKTKGYKNQSLLQSKNQNIVSSLNNSKNNTNSVNTKFANKNEVPRQNIARNSKENKNDFGKNALQNKNDIIASNQENLALINKNKSINSKNIGSNKDYLGNINSQNNNKNVELSDQKNPNKLLDNPFLAENNLIKNNEKLSEQNQFKANNQQMVIEQVDDSNIEKLTSKNDENKFLVDTKSNSTKNHQKITSLNQLANIDVLNSNNPNSSVNQNSNLPTTNVVSALVLNDKKIDSLNQNTIAENPLDKILKDKEAEKTEENNKDLVVEKQKKWKVRPNAAPIYMSSSGGSPIDPRFSDNSKSYNNNLSIGVGVDYALSKRLSIRTGINKFDLSYNTNDIAFFANLKEKDSYSTTRANSMPSVTIAQTALIVTISDSFGLNSIDPEIGQNKKTGSLNQSFGYLEFPTEISYKIIDKKFGIQFITGFSTLVLNNNKLSLVSNGTSTEVGQANNLNTINFSSNVGVGFKYSFWKSFEANFEPTFKYQFFTFNRNSEGFKPYFIGLYSGISYKF